MYACYVWAGYTTADGQATHTINGSTPEAAASSVRARQARLEVVKVGVHPIGLGVVGRGEVGLVELVLRLDAHRVGSP